ncbi:cation:proton antiporter [Palleronia marisminoris]|uniref:cation:proton antiporter domain-containing protein n=1 Tax=Palleronia marisminoris TaxID=315423 RepID=UPI0015877861|nr:cation:proton antiporter [Palleronia marisminoris]
MTALSQTSRDPRPETDLHQVNTAIALAGFVVVIAGLISDRLGSLPMAKPIIAMTMGIVAGPEVLRWLQPQDWPHSRLILKEAARFTLAISVFGIALRTPKESYRHLLRPLGLLLTVGMLVMWLVSAGLAWLFLGISPLMALLLGAIVTPTDPVVASSIVTGSAAERSLPDRLRSTLSLESGANDGLAYLIVLLPILLISHGTSSGAFDRWLVDVLLVGVVLAVVVGLVIGYVAAVALHHADELGWVGKTSLISLSVALSLVVVSTAKLVGSDGILAAFAAGAAFNFGVDRGEEFEEQQVQEGISKLFNLPVFTIFGAMLPWREWFGLGWQVPAFAVAIVLLRRPIALLVTGRWLGAGLVGRDAAFLGWFGPVGVAAIYYALHAEERLRDPATWHVASLVIVVSILVHGVTSGPGLAAYRRASA